MHFATKNAIFIIVKQMPFINIGLKAIRPRPITGVCLGFVSQIGSKFC